MGNDGLIADVVFLNIEMRLDKKKFVEFFASIFNSGV